MLKQFILVGLGGALGSMLRFWAGNAFKRSDFPYATLLINITGCFLIGLVWSYFAKHELQDQAWKSFLAAGLCGGFTTFSAFSLENLQLIQEGRWPVAVMYAMTSVVGGLIAVWAGYRLIA